jgi:hypothetical protein
MIASQIAKHVWRSTLFACCLFLSEVRGASLSATVQAATLQPGAGGVFSVAITGASSAPNLGLGGSACVNVGGCQYNLGGAAGAIGFEFLNVTSSSALLVIYVPPGVQGSATAFAIPVTAGSTAIGTLSLTVQTVLTAQSISFGSIAAQIVGTPLALAASATSGLPVSYTSSTGGVCSISGDAANFVGAGTCTITASQSGNTTYSAASPVSQSFHVTGSAAPVSAYSTICQAQSGGASYCTDQTPSSADANGYHDLVWVNLNKSLASIAVSDNQVWGLDSSGVLWYLPNFKTGTVWTMVASGVSQISAGHNLVCQISSNQHVLCSNSTNYSQGAISWFDTGATNLKQIAVSAGMQLWAVDTSGNLIRVTDYTHLASTSTFVASGVQQVAVDGRGMVCQVNSNRSVYCSNWSVPAAEANPAPYHGLPWVQAGAQLQNICVADGQVWGTDSNGNVWELPDYTNSATWFPIAFGGAGDKLAAASTPSQFIPADFGSNEVAVLLFMGQSNSVGYNILPTRFISQSSPNVWGVQNGGWNFLAGNTNGTTPFTGTVSSITSVQWTNFALTPGGPDMNLGFNNDAGPGGDAANFSAYQWQGLINAGWNLPDLYIVHIAWPSQGVDAADTTAANAAWTAHGVNLWQPGLTASQMPSYALAPFARQVVYRALQNILASGKTPRLMGLQWNQWEAEAGNPNTVSLTDAPANYKSLVNGFFAAIGSHYPIQFVKPLSTAYGAAALSEMQSVFSNMATNDPADISVIDVSQVSSNIFSGGVLGGGDGSVHYNLDTHKWFATQAIGTCLVQANCGTPITVLPSSAPN